MSKRWVWGLLVLLPALTLGCQPVNTLEKDRRQAQPDSEAVKKIERDAALARSLKIKSVYRDDSSGVLRVQANLENHAGSPCDFKYRFNWFDGKGMELYDPASAWSRKTLSPGEFASLTGVAPSPKAMDWRLSVQTWDR
jgi:uncharacterized protein YcfL